MFADRNDPIERKIKDVGESVTGISLSKQERIKSSIKGKGLVL